MNSEPTTNKKRWVHLFMMCAGLNSAVYIVLYWIALLMILERCSPLHVVVSSLALWGVTVVAAILLSWCIFRLPAVVSVRRRLVFVLIGACWWMPLVLLEEGAASDRVPFEFLLGPWVILMLAVDSYCLLLKRCLKSMDDTADVVRRKASWIWIGGYLARAGLFFLIALSLLELLVGYGNKM